MENIKTSVIIPVYNVEKYIRECLESVFAQTQKEMEVIVVDDGSTDGSMEIVREYQEKYNSLRIISQRNQGLGAARNTGFRNARGKYVYYLDSDDCIKPDLLEACYECAESEKLQMVLFDAEIFADGQTELVMSEDIYDRKNKIRDCSHVYAGLEFFDRYEAVGGFMVPVWLAYTSREFLMMNGVKFQEGILHEDIAYTFELMMLVERLKYLPQKFYRRRIREGSITQGGKMESRMQGHFYAIEKMVHDIKRYVNDTENDKYLHYSAKLLLYAMLLGKGETLKQSETQKMAFRCMEELWGELLPKGTCIDYNLICRLYERYQEVFGDASDEIRKIYEVSLKERDTALRDILRNIPLGDCNKIIAVYGTGKHTDKLLAEYERLIGEIYAKLYYFNSALAEENMWYRDEQVYCIDELEAFRVDLVLISSVQYEEEMVRKLKELYGKKYAVIRFYEKERYNLFL